MNSNKDITYEYKTVVVKCSLVALYTNSFQDFGWKLVKKQPSKHVSQVSVNPYYVDTTPAEIGMQTTCEKAQAVEMMILRFCRERKFDNNKEIEILEIQCENALSGIERLEKKSNVHTLDFPLSADVAALPVEHLACQNTNKKETKQLDSLVQKYLSIARGASKQAHVLLKTPKEKTYLTQCESLLALAV